MQIPNQYQWLNNIGTLPKLIAAAMQYLGVKEIPGKASNPVIMNMAKQLGITDIYTNDDEPWCALFISFLCFICGKPIAFSYNLIRAISFSTWGNKVELYDIRLGDIVVIKRKGGYHVCLAIANTDKGTLHVIGGNQSNQVCFTEINKEDIVAVRRNYKTGLPESAKVYKMDSTGNLIKSAA